jgi:hypothetical protein
VGVLNVFLARIKKNNGIKRKYYLTNLETNGLNA